MARTGSTRGWWLLMGAAQVLGGRYRLVERLGQGGMSVVWLGYDEVLGRPVAIKVLTARFAAHARSADRIRVEAQAAARLSHPHVTAVHDYGEAIGEAGERVPYVVMELLSGRTLGARLKEGPLPVPAALLVCAQVASALAAAHTAGLVHRDIKPSNVMLTPAGVKVLDFGLAAEAGAEAESALDGEVLGTPAYLAPERLVSGEVAPASDVYGLGLLLYAAVTGGLPWRADTVSEMLAAHWYAEPAPLPAATGVPRHVRALYQRCLAKDPRDRPTAEQVAAGLAQATVRRRHGRSWVALAVTSTAPLPDPETSIVRAAVPTSAPPEPAAPNRWGAVALAGSATVVVAALVGGMLVPVEEGLLPGSPEPGIAAPNPALSPSAPDGSVSRPNAGESRPPGMPGQPGPEDMLPVSATQPGSPRGSGGAAPEVSGPATDPGAGGGIGGGTGTGPTAPPTTPGPSSPPPPSPAPSPVPEPEPEPSPSPEPLVETVQEVVTGAGPLVVQCVGSTVTLVSENLLPGFTVTDPGPGTSVSIGLAGQTVLSVGCQSGAPAVTLDLLG